MSSGSDVKLKVPYEFVSKNEQQTFNFAEMFGRQVSLGSVVALFGGLGVGKTVFVKGFSKGVGFLGDVCSPTFSIINEYVIDSRSVVIVHCDMYRVHSQDDLISVGFFEYLNFNGSNGFKNIIITEWSENISQFLPDKCYRINLSRLSDNERLIKITKGV